ncbi:putative baseplate assembly protein [Roseomonas populi]|uniref:Baseplate assembly protein n=1 Tax=Roseomonas populi TaxID=3121582 RepID=A0ABT1X3S0_9PROT|nr:putative baseplate assembly protein [Roseomonas pecuniae]MCR0982760.1 putative baseplate assembly protein [Roseomonas pecuniae]
MTRYTCCDDRRRGAIAGRADLNGLDSLEVVDTAEDPRGPPLTTLVLRFVNTAPLPALSPANILLTGGGSIRGIGVTAVRLEEDEAGPALVVSTDRAGDFSVYHLRLRAAPGEAGPPLGMDPVLSGIDFTFRPGCESDFDAVAPAPCPPPARPTPPLDYLARDYASLRQLMLDRVAVLGAAMPGDDLADLGITLIEMLAAVGDHLSYRQDAVATEAALHTVRQRISARRHARLVDYVMHNGCNARAWVAFTFGAGAAAPVHLPAGSALLTRLPGRGSLLAPGPEVVAEAVAAGAVPFETMEAVELRPELDLLRFHAWGGRECCLPRGALGATLRGDLTKVLAPGRVLVIQERLNPATGDAQGADPAHRCAVRLTRVTAGVDPLGGAFDDPPTEAPLPVTEIEWAAEDALPFPVCVSALLDAPGGAVAVEDVSTACGNVVLADHGMTLPEPEALGRVPSATVLALAAPRPAETLTDAPEAACAHRAWTALPPRFNPVLREGPLTHAAPYGPAQRGSAAAATRYGPAEAWPAVLGVSSAAPDGTDADWVLRYPDLLGAQAEAAFTVEVDNDLRGHLRFGDGRHGLRPPEGAAFSARYRVGNGVAGNVGAGAIAHLVAALGAVALKPDNPMPATGGAEAESIESVRRRAPAAFRVQQRAVTPADYAEGGRRLPGIQRAAAALRWTGSWHTHVVAVDRLGGEEVDETFAGELTDALEPLRLLGHDVQVVAPNHVALEIGLAVEIGPAYFRAALRQALLAVLDTGPGGLFHPDRFTFGQAVYLSPILAAVQSVPGVVGVEATAFRRYAQPRTDAAAAGVLPLAANEIARLDNDPSFPDRGVLRLQLWGGQ